VTESQNIVFVTCKKWPNLSLSDTASAKELTERGHSVLPRAWNTAPLIDFTSADIVVLRSNWDFHHDFGGFNQWLSQVDLSDAELHNSAELVRTYADKSYLRNLASLGIPAPETVILPAFDEPAIAQWMDQHNLDRVVVKPAWGASGHDVHLVQRIGLKKAANRWHASPDKRPVVVQEFVPQIRDGEHTVVFFGGEFSHALHRSCGPDDFRVNSQYGGTTVVADAFSSDTIDLATSVLATLPIVPTYARIDIVGKGSELRLMEIEVNEPGLGCHLVPESAARFADALLGEAQH